MAFQPDLVWTKTRSQPFNHSIYDSVRGVNKLLQSNTTIAEFPATNALNSFDSNGFTLGANDNSNTNGESSVAWCWKAGGAAVTNTDGDIASSVSANPDAGFSIVKWTGDGNASSTVGHGLSSKAELIIQKTLSTTGGWFVVSSELSNNEYLALQANIAATTDAGSSGAPASVNNNNDTTFGFRSGTTNADNVNKLNDNYIAYCFHSVDGYQKVGSYNGNNPSPSTILDINVGFTPRFVLLKNTTTSGPGWNMFDNLRSSNSIWANSANQEADYSSVFEIINNGFRLKSINTNTNYQTDKFIYLAIA